MPGWGNERKKMDAALRQITVPKLRERGFEGTYPNLFRCRPEGLDFLGFLFHRYGPSFTVELAHQPGPAQTSRPSKDDQYRATFRARLPQIAFIGFDEWFEFKPRPPPIGMDMLRSSEKLNPHLPPPSAAVIARAKREQEDDANLRSWGERVYEERARQVNDLLPVAEVWWEHPRPPPEPLP